MSQTVVLSYQNLHGFFRLSRIPGTPELQTSLMLNLMIYHGISPHVKRNPLQPLAILWSVAAGASRCSQPGDSAEMGRWEWLSAPENGGYPYVMLFSYVIGKMTMIFWHKPKYCKWQSLGHILFIQHIQLFHIVDAHLLLCDVHDQLVGGFNHLEKYSSMGRMTSLLWNGK